MDFKTVKFGAKTSAERRDYNRDIDLAESQEL